MQRTIILTCCLSLFLAGCSEPPLVEVDGKDISRQTFGHFLAHKNIAESNTAQVKRVLDEFARREAMAAAIVKAGELDMDAIEVEVNEFRKQLLISRHFEQFLEQRVDDAAVANYYAAHADQYRSRKAHLAHILLRVRPDMSEQERAAKLTAAAEALSRINRGEDFAEVAKAASEDGLSAAKGGDLGWMKEGAVSPEFSAAAFALEPGAVSEVIATPFGFHIIKQLAAPQEVTQPLEAATGSIRYLLRQQAKDAEAERLMKSVKLEVGEWQ